MSETKACKAYFDGVDYVPEEYEGWEVARVMTELPDMHTPPFGGPEHLDYWNFDGEEWEWRSLVDRCAELAREVLDRGLDLEQAEKRWPEMMPLSERFYDELEWSRRSDEGLTEEEVFRDLMQDYARRLRTESIYDCEGDEHFGDARDALDLPEWAEPFEYLDGGPGSGFTAYCIAVRPPHKWDDLVAWLKERQAMGPPKKRRRK